MSATPNSSTAARTCSTREPSWAEDFIDLSEFCQPSAIPTRMEDSVDERITSPISNAVRNHGFDYGLDGNEGLDPSLEETLWYLPSPSTIQDELCDPISDWLAATKDTISNSYSSSGTSNNDNLLPSSRTEISYNLNDAFLSPRLTSVPNATPLYDRKSMAFCPDDSLTPPLQPDTTFFHSSVDPVAYTEVVPNRQSCVSAATTSAAAGASMQLGSSLLGHPLESHTLVRLPSVDSLFKEEQSPPPPQPPPPPLPAIARRASASSSSVPAAVTAAAPPLAAAASPSPSSTSAASSFQHQQLQPSSSSVSQFLECEPEVDGSGRGCVTVNASVSFPCSVQSPSISQSSAPQPKSSNSSRENETARLFLPSSAAPSTPLSQMRDRAAAAAARQKLDSDGSLSAASSAAAPSCPAVEPPEMLNPLVGKNTEFDLVSYVFEDNKPSIAFSLPNLSSNSSDDDEKVISEMSAAAAVGAASAAVSGGQVVTIKTEPKDEAPSSAVATAAAAAVTAAASGKASLEQQLSAHHQLRVKRKFVLLERKEDEDGDASSSSSSAHKMKRPRRYSNCSSDDLTQIESEKYRELRNKNNEASRRSRANRKNREVEMREHAFKLDAENRRLKVKAEEMEKLVKRLRNCLMQLVLKRG